MSRPATSVVALLFANAFPVVGVLAFGWRLADVMLLFWAETAVIGLFNVLKMFRIGGVRAVPLVGFFCVHFGIFMFVHLMFLVSMVLTSDAPVHGPVDALTAVSESASTWRLGLVGLLASHGLSFVANFLGRREFEERTLQQQMGRPYGRVIVMHFAILLGGFATMALGAPSALLVLLIAGKVALDVSAHRREHR